ncbi:MAG TPA: DUF2065 domain-containing protein [Candidatus Macondimonas sp.]|nr:DUF2065 domain-containing protein [Candidatus Macondimonas sp.]
MAIGFVMLLEGILPAAAPRLWQRGLAQIGALPASVVRLLGFASLALGWLIVRGAD